MVSKAKLCWVPIRTIRWSEWLNPLLSNKREPRASSSKVAVISMPTARRDLITLRNRRT